MSLKYAILGLLTYKPQTGYEIKTNFNLSVRYLWNADQTQIYRNLTELAKEELVLCTKVQQDGRPNKKVYEITDAGIVELKEWLASPVASKNQRNAELLQVFYSGMLSNEKILNNMTRLRENTMKALEGLSALEKISELFNPENTSKRTNYFYKATLDLGVRSAKLNLEWLNEIIQKLENQEIS